jgi:hypothetical protein
MANIRENMCENQWREVASSGMEIVESLQQAGLLISEAFNVGI